MTPDAHSAAERQLVAAMLGREPRDPWRVSSRCRFGFPNTIASPSTLADGTPFPTLVWLTCPWLAERISSVESAGAASRWTQRAAVEPALAESLQATARALRAARDAESGGADACEGVGIAGQKDALKVKCLHAHLALALFGLSDPIGCALLGDTGDACPDGRCARLVPGDGGKADD